MKLLLPCLLLAALVACVAAWTKEDHEIFDLVSAVESSEGKRTTFYSWLGVPPTASTSEIAKAYRKKSIQIHPDKNPNDKKAHERFARLGVVAAILRSPEGRERYDFFCKNGVPRWRGTGYYYSRFRPGLGTVLVFLTILSSSLQYLVQSVNYKRDLGRIESIVSQARSAAWGAKLVPSEGQKKVRVNLGGPPRLDEDGNVVGGKMVDMVVEGNDVYFLDTDGSLHPVNSDTATAPSLKRTWFIVLLISLYEKVAKKGVSASDVAGAQTNGVDAHDSEDGSATASDAPGSGTVTPKNGSATGSLKGGRAAAATMAGGRRRKAVRKR